VSGPHIDGAEAMYNALSVIVLDERINAWLVEHDMMALLQARAAMAQYAAEQNEVLNQLAEDDPSDGGAAGVDDAAQTMDLRDVYVGPLDS
jgi:hypothetical protein